MHKRRRAQFGLGLFYKPLDYQQRAETLISRFRSEAGFSLIVDPTPQAAAAPRSTAEVVLKHIRLWR